MKKRKRIVKEVEVHFGKLGYTVKEIQKKKRGNLDLGNKPKEKKKQTVFTCNDCENNYYQDEEPMACKCGVDNFGIWEKEV